MCLLVIVMTVLSGIVSSLDGLFGCRDLRVKTNPSLVPWQQLDELQRDNDRVLVKCIPKILASVGYYCLAGCLIVVIELVDVLLYI